MGYQIRYGKYQFRKMLDGRRVSATFPTIEEGEAWLAEPKPTATEQPKPVKRPPLSIAEQRPATGLVGQPDRVAVYSVQNDTEICLPFKRALEFYCAETDHTEVAVPTRYQNLTAFSTKEDRGASWVAGLPYINETLNITKHVAIFPTVMRSATNINPLAGIKNRSKISMAIGTNRQHVRSIASPQGTLPTMLFGTGSMTMENFRLAGGANAKSGFTLGALIIERIPGSEMFLWRRVEWRENCFWDLNRCWGEHGEIFRVAPQSVLSLGDFHAEDTLSEVWKATCEMQKVLSPTYTFLHDLVTFRNGHHQTVFDRLKSTAVKVDDGFRTAADYLERMVLGWDTKLHVVNSNHDKHLDGWLARYTHKEWPSDAIFYHKMMLAIIEDRTDRDPFYHAMDLATKPEIFNKIHWLRQAESVISIHHENGNHGHAGPNGARGGPGAWDKMTVRQVVFHSHSVGAGDNWVQGGTSGPLDESFHSSYSSCLNAHVLEYDNGTSTILPIINGIWII